MVSQIFITETLNKEKGNLNLLKQVKVFQDLLKYIQKTQVQKILVEVT